MHTDTHTLNQKVQQTLILNKFSTILDINTKIHSNCFHICYKMLYKYMHEIKI